MEKLVESIEARPNQSFCRVATCNPAIELGDVEFNSGRIVEMIDRADEQKTDIVVFPELSLTGYTIKDLHNNQKILADTERAIELVAQSTKNRGVTTVIGAGISWMNGVYNVGVVCSGGEIVGVVPKSYLPNYGEFEEKRWFREGLNIQGQTAKLNGKDVPFGTDLIFDKDGNRFGIEICEDLWSPNPPSSSLSVAEAEIILNLSASNELVGKAQYRRNLICSQAARCIVGYIYASSGVHESTGDLVFSGHSVIAERGSILEESKRFMADEQIMVSDIDMDTIRHDRIVDSNFDPGTNSGKYRIINVNARDDKPTDLRRNVNGSPFVPSKIERRKDVAEEVFNIQAHGLATTLRKSNIKKVVLGLSGGLDSTLALLVAVKAMDILGYSPDSIHAITMPGLASSDRTQSNATGLARVLGVTHQELSIVSMSEEMLKVLGHDGEQDVTYENAQARMRTSILFNKANQIGGLLVGTGDLSEIVLGWCTLNGDQMSNYNVNASVPKTLVKFLIEWVSNQPEFIEASKTLLDILDTPISPELTTSEAGIISQNTEDIVGPYQLHDFFLYRLLRHGESPAKIGYMALNAFKDEYSLEDIARWLTVFITRFTQNQHKRESAPNGPKVGTVGVSQRGDLRLPPVISSGWYGKITS